MLEDRSCQENNSIAAGLPDKARKSRRDCGPLKYQNTPYPLHFLRLQGDVR